MTNSLSTIPINRLNPNELNEKINMSVEEKADIDLSNLSTVGQDILDNKLNKQMISNCLTHIPQDIKIELVDGTLTLKAGSKVYVPNGFEEDGTTQKFDKIIIENDLTTTQSANGEMSIFYASEDNALLTFYSSASASGTTTPADSKSFYNTADNTVYRYNGGVKATKLSFALGLATVSSGALSSIDRVFNGFGYIGSTVFAFPGVKGLVPNGRNADGSLKNIEFTVDKVLTRSFTGTQKYYVFLSNDYIGILDKTIYYYDQHNNYNLNRTARYDLCYIADVDLQDSKITYFTPKTPFHAVDYNSIPQHIEVSTLPANPNSNTFYYIPE